MNSSLLQSNLNCFEFRNYYEPKLSLDESVNLLDNSEEENSFIFTIKNPTLIENDVNQKILFNDDENSDNKNNFINEQVKNSDYYSQLNSINNFNENYMNLNAISLSTTNNSNSFANIGVKNEEILLDS